MTEPGKIQEENQQPLSEKPGVKTSKDMALNPGETYTTKTYALAGYLDENEKSVVEDLLEKYFYGEASVERDWLANEKTPEKMFDRFFERMAPQEFLMAMEECRRYYFYSSSSEPADASDICGRLMRERYIRMMERFKQNRNQIVQSMNLTDLMFFGLPGAVKGAQLLLNDVKEFMASTFVMLKQVILAKRESILKNYRPLTDDEKEVLADNTIRLRKKIEESGGKVSDSEVSQLALDIRKQFVLEGKEFKPDVDGRILIEVDKLSKKSREFLNKNKDILMKSEDTPKLQKINGKLYLVYDGKKLLPERKLGTDAEGLSESMATSVMNYASKSPLVKQAEKNHGQKGAVEALKDVAKALMLFYQVGHTNNPNKMEINVHKVEKEIGNALSPIERDTLNWLKKRAIGGKVTIPQKSVEENLKNIFVKEAKEDKDFFEYLKNLTPYKFSPAHLPTVPDERFNISLERLSQELKDLDRKLEIARRRGGAEEERKVLREFLNDYGKDPIKTAAGSLIAVAGLKNTPDLVRKLAEGKIAVDTRKYNNPNYAVSILHTISKVPGVSRMSDSEIMQSLANFMGSKVQTAKDLVNRVSQTVNRVKKNTFTNSLKPKPKIS